MAKTKAKIKYYVIVNDQGDYGRFDIYGWDTSEHVFWASKFSTRKEALAHAAAVNYVTANPRNTYKVSVGVLVKA